MLVNTQDQARAILDNWNAVVAPLALMQLFKAPSTVSQGMTLADFTMADYLGYTAQTPVFGAATAGPGPDEAEIQATQIDNISTDPTPQEILGYIVHDAAFTQVYFAELNPAGPVVVNNGDNYAVILKLSQKGQ